MAGNSSRNIMKKVEQGAIFMADLNPGKGHEQKGYRPVMVVQNNILNNNLNTVLVAPVTGNMKAAGYLTTFLLEKLKSGLVKDSVALLFQLRAIDSRRLKKRVGVLNRNEFREVKRRIGLLF